MFPESASPPPLSSAPPAAFCRYGLTLLAVIAALLLFAWVALQPMWDADLWWHMKTGELIMQQGALPVEDPFAFTSANFSTVREKAILQGYPLSQMLYAQLHRWAGFPGLLALRILLLGTLSAIVIRGARQRRATTFAVALVLTLGWACFYWAHTADRPQLYSFLFFALLVIALRPVGRESWWLVPMMALWANFHGGYIVGDLALLVYLGGRWLDVGRSAELWRSALWVAACLAASFVNPNGPYFLIETLAGSVAGSAAAGIAEYQSSFAILASGKYWVLALWAELALALAARIARRRLIWAELLPLLLFAVLGLLYVRMTAFFALGLLPLIAADVSFLLTSLRPRVALVAGLVLVVLVSLPAYVNGRDVMAGWKVFWPEQNAFYPAQSIPFLETADLQGRMFNYYAWGGYLIWKLYPQYQVFIDGRAFDDRLFADYQSIENGNLAVGASQYTQLLDHYRIDYAVIPLQNIDGSLLPLFTRLYQNPAWSPVYVDRRSVIFVREGGRNEQLLAKNRILPADFFSQVIEGFRSRVASNGGDLSAWQGGVEFYLAAARYQEARSVLTQALQVAPAYPAFLRLQAQLGGAPLRR